MANYTISQIELPNGDICILKDSASLKKDNVINSLTNTATDLPLSAAKGKELNDNLTALTASYNSLVIPTKTSDLINDSGFLTSFTETDPTVPAWAKAATKPSYTAAEVGAVAKTGDTMTGNLEVGQASDTSERDVGVKSAAGTIYLYSTGSNTGNRGIYASNAAGTSVPVIEITQNNQTYFYGRASQNVYKSGDTMTGDLLGNSTANLGTTANPFHRLVLGGATSNTMTANSPNPGITFQENTGVQPVHLIYTDADSYRSPAGLKIIGGSNATPAWFEVEGQVYAAGFNGSLNGNAATATKLATARNINGTAFDGSAAITTANWGTARNITIKDASSTNAGTAVSVNGSAAVTLLLPSTIKASITGNCSGSSGSCTGNAATATKATQDSDGNTIKSTYLKLSGGTITGTLVLSNATDASGTTDNGPALIVGGTRMTGHLEMDGNEIIAKSDGTHGSTLYLNSDGGGDVYIGSGGLRIGKALAIAYGGTGATTAAGARTNLGTSLYINSNTSATVYNQLNALNTGEAISAMLTETAANYLSGGKVTHVVDGVIRKANATSYVFAMFDGVGSAFRWQTTVNASSATVGNCYKFTGTKI